MLGGFLGVAGGFMDHPACLNSSQQGIRSFNDLSKLCYVKKKSINALSQLSLYPISLLYIKAFSQESDMKDGEFKSHCASQNLNAL